MATNNKPPVVYTVTIEARFTILTDSPTPENVARYVASDRIRNGSIPIQISALTANENPAGVDKG